MTVTEQRWDAPAPRVASGHQDIGRTLADCYEAGELHDVEERLIARFCPPLRPEEVQRRLVESMAAFEDARVRTYLPILVERAAARRLQLVASSQPPASPHPPAGRVLALAAVAARA